MSALLELARVDTFYGKTQVLHDVSFAVASGAITVLIGRNGSGKTTTLRSIVGLTPPRRGQITLAGRAVTGSPPHRMFHAGVGYVPEGRQIFPELTVGENLRLASRAVDAGARWTMERIFEHFPVLRDRWSQKGRSLSGGEQQMLALARALAGHPQILLLDEPSQGLAPLLVKTLADIMRRLRDDGLTILLVEQNVRLALGLADQVAVLSKGRVVFAGPPVDFHAREEELRGRYLAV